MDGRVGLDVSIAPVDSGDPCDDSADIRHRHRTSQQPDRDPDHGPYQANDRRAVPIGRRPDPPAQVLLDSRHCRGCVHHRELSSTGPELAPWPSVRLAAATGKAEWLSCPGDVGCGRQQAARRDCRVPARSFDPGGRCARGQVLDHRRRPGCLRCVECFFPLSVSASPHHEDTDVRTDGTERLFGYPDADMVLFCTGQRSAVWCVQSVPACRGRRIAAAVATSGSIAISVSVPAPGFAADGKTNPSILPMEWFAAVMDSGVCPEHSLEGSWGMEHPR